MFKYHLAFIIFIGLLVSFAFRVPGYALTAHSNTLSLPESYLPFGSAGGSGSPLARHFLFTFTNNCAVAQGDYGMPISIKELAEQSGFKGPISHRRAEPAGVRTLPIVDNSDQFNKSVRTSVDCYVSGQYVQSNGRVMEVTQRYTIFVSYNKETQFASMQQVRERIVNDFSDKYGNSFNVANVFVPDLPVPVSTPTGGTSEDEVMYGGSKLFREMTRFEKQRYEIGTERLKADTNIASIKSRYALRGRK